MHNMTTRQAKGIDRATKLSAMLFGAVLLTGIAVAEPMHPADLELKQQKTPSKSWLRDADSDAERFRRIEINERGFSQAMAEVGNRFLEVHEAVSHGEYELATYYWEKIEDAINTGLMRRPDRTRNAEGMFLNGPWQQTHAALQSGDRERIRESLRNARQACMACHIAEGVDYMNASRALRQTAP
ncbi:MAG: hypothetical protein WDZ63_07510 [Burkholderiales bacterium]